MNKKKTAGALGIVMATSCLATPSITVSAETINHESNKQVNVQSDINNKENKVIEHKEKSNLDNDKKDSEKKVDLVKEGNSESINKEDKKINIESNNESDVVKSKEDNNVKSSENKGALKEAAKKDVKLVSEQPNGENNLDKASISINNVWWQHIGTLTFDSKNMKFGFSKSWAETNPYAHKDEFLFSISLINQSGIISKTVKVYGGGSHPQEELYNELNNLSFQYGDKILIDYKESSKLKISGLMSDGQVQKPYNVGKRTVINIEKTGLSLFTNEKLSVDPLRIEGLSNKVTSCTIKGITTPESKVTVLLNGKQFTGKSNYVGTFEIPVNDESGIKGSTAITICVGGQAPIIVYPTSAPNLGISKSSITTKFNAGLTGETVSFDTTNLKIGISVGGSNQFSLNLINNEGKPVAKAETPYFNGFSGEENIKGASFEYGNILSLYQSKKSQINWNNPTVNTATGKQTLGTDEFNYYRITVDGLKKISNSSLTVNSPSYDGDLTVDITGTTTPNTDVTVSGGTYSIKVKSNSKGDYDAKIPESDIKAGEIISVYVNNDNFKQVIYNYASSYALGNSKIQVSSQYTQPIFYIGFDPETKEFTAAKNIVVNNYSGSQVSGNTVGTFYTNRFKFTLLNSKTGESIYTISTSKLNDSNDFVKYINGKSFNIGDIIELSYNTSLINIGVTNGKTGIGNKELGNQYFGITNKGLVSVSNKFISLESVNILGTESNSTTIKGTVKPNESVNINVDGKDFSGIADSKGGFSVPITSSNNFDNNTKIIVSSEGYIPTTVKLSYENTTKLQNSHINFYNGSWSLDSIQSSIGFDVDHMKFTVQNYMDSFGNGKEDYFKLGLYGSDGSILINPTEVKNGTTEALSNLLNGKSFKYGEVISLSYNSKVSIPSIVNGNDVLGNIDGTTQYFEITKEGIKKVNFGNKIYANKVQWINGELTLDLTLATGNNISLKSGELQVVDSSNKLLIMSSILNGKSSITEGQFNKLVSGGKYTFRVKLGDKIIPIYIASNIPSYGNYILMGNDKNELSISVINPNISINNSNDIKNYGEEVNKEISKNITSNEEVVQSLVNEKLMTDLIANSFINRFGIVNLQNFYNENSNNTRFISWLLNNDIAMSEYLQATNLGEGNIQGLQIWSDIWNTYINSHYGFDLKLAISTALATENPIRDCFNGKPIGSPVERYNIFERLNSEGGMVKGFTDLNVKMLEAVVNVPITNPQILEMRGLILQNHNNLVSGNHLPSADYTINYNFRNPYNGASIFGSWADFYGKDETVADVFKIGGVCGSISRLGSVACRVFGQPAHQMGEPGHDAFYSYNMGSGNWSSQYGETVVANATGFDVSNWSNGLALNGNTVTYTDLYSAANNENLVKSNEYLWIADSSISYELKLNAINEALKVQPLNIEAWLAKIDLLNNNPNVTSKDYISLSNDIMSELKSYPEPMFDLLVKFNKNMIQVSTTDEYNTFVNKVKSELNSINQNGNSNEKTQANRILTGGYLEKYGFIENQIKTLGKININSWKKNSPTDSIAFGSDGKITVNASHTWIGSNGNSGITIKTFSSNMEGLKTIKVSGTDFGTNIIKNSFNNTDFKVGEILEIIYNPGLASDGYLTVEDNHLKTSKVNNIVAAQITNNGPKILNGKYTAPNGKEYDFSTGFEKGSKGTKYEIFGENQTGFQYVGDGEYYFNKDGFMETGLQNINNKGYYFNEEGVLQTGWQNINGEKYYFSDNGTAIPGYNTIDGKEYLFGNNGLEINNIIPNSAMKISSYSSEQNSTTYSPNNIIDGKLNDNWQNKWNHSDKNPYITIELDKAYNINQLVCFPRQDGGQNGDIEEYKILTSIDGKNFKEAASGSWVYSNSKESQFVNLKGVKAKYIKIECEKGVFGLATISEVVISGTDVNKTALQEEIAKGKEKLTETEGYTQESINALKDAISKGENGLNNKSLSQEEINTLSNNIKDTIVGLKVDKSGLQNALAKANNILKVSDDYTESSIKILQGFVTSGEEVMNNNSITPVQVKAATLSILSGINGLKVNKTDLNKALINGEDLLENKKDYTKLSIDTLNKAVLDGESVIKNLEATPEEVSKAENSILDAINGLEKLPIVVKPDDNKNTDNKDSGNSNTGKTGDSINKGDKSNSSSSKNTVESTKNDSSKVLEGNSSGSSIDVNHNSNSLNNKKDISIESNDKNTKAKEDVGNYLNNIISNQTNNKDNTWETWSSKNISRNLNKEVNNNREMSNKEAYSEVVQKQNLDNNKLADNSVDNTKNTEKNIDENIKARSNNEESKVLKENDTLDKVNENKVTSKSFKNNIVYGVGGLVIAAIIAGMLFFVKRKNK